MTSPTPRSVTVRLAMDTSSYIAGASRAEASTLSLDKAVQKVGPSAATSLGRAEKSAGSAETMLGKLNKTAGGLGVTLGGLAGVGGALAVGMSVKWAADYQSALTRLVTTAGESPKNIKAVGQAFLDMAGQVGISADEIAKGAYTAESAGFHGADAVTVMKAASEGARQENADLGKVVNATTTILHDYHLGADQAAKVTSQLITAVSHGKVSFDELTGALDAITPLAARAGISIADVTGTLAAMTASGMSADQATQNMQNTLLHLVNPSQTMIAELAQLGVSTDDLANSLSTRGLAGTLQMVEEAIVQHVDPATQRVLLPALNQSKSAAADLQIMLAQMPPALAKLSQGFLDGSVSMSDYRKDVRDLGGANEAMGTQFLSLVQSSQGFNNVLKAGGPNAQVFTAAMAKAFGTTSALNVALQTTGENAAATNAAIKDIAGATAQADGNIKGWDEVQGNFNQQLAQFEAHAKSLAIEAGQHLLPILTSTFGWINSTGIPALEHMGSAVGTTAHWFGELPAPIRETAAAMAGLAIAEKVGLLDKLGTGAGRVGGAFKSMASDMSTAFAAAKANQVRMVEESSALWGTVETQAQSAASTNGSLWASTAKDVEQAGGAMDRARGNVAGLGAAAGAAAKGGLGALKAGASGLMGMFGGPWGVALIGATLGVTAFMDAIARHDAMIKQATADVQKWDEAVALGGGGTSAISAQKHLDDLRGKIAALQEQIDRYNAAAQGGYARGGIGTLLAQQRELQGELDKGTSAWKEQLAGMTPVQVAQERLTLAQQDLNDALKNNPPTSAAVTWAESNLASAQHQLALETDGANRATKTQIQQQQDQANKALGLVDAQRQAQEASLALTQQVTDYNKQIADGTLKGDALTQATLGIVDSAEQAAKAAGDAAAKQAAQNGATDTGAASQAAFMKALQDFDSTLTGPAKKAMDDYIAQLGGQQSQAQLTAGAINGLGVQVTGLPDSHMITIDVPTDQQMQKLHDLGYATVNLPNGQVVVSADTKPALGEIQDLLAYARQQSIQYRSDLPDLVPGVSGGGRMGHAATGGWISGPGTGTSDSIPMWLSNGEFVVNAASAAQHGTLLEALNSGMGRMAAGGWVNVPTGGWYAGAANVPLTIDESQAKGVIAQLYRGASAFAPGAPAAVSGNVALGQQVAASMFGWTGAEWNALYAIGMRESGWRNTAQNPTSTAYGIGQLLDGTWASTGIAKTSDPRLQEIAMDRYIASRYRDPINAWGHETRFGWYDGGGVLPPGATLALNGTGQNETIRTAAQEASLQRVLRTREFGGLGGGATVIHHTDARSYPLTVQGGEGAQAMVRAFRDAQYVQDFLHG